MKRRFLAVIVVLVIAVVAVRAFIATPDAGDRDAPPLVSVAIVDGGVQREPSGGAAVDAFDGDVLAPGDAISTDAEGVAVLTFFDGSTIQLEPSSRVVIRELQRSGDGTRSIVVDQTDGDTWASVAPQTSPNARFDIVLPDSTAAVKGTALRSSVNKATGVSSVYVQDGAVEMRSPKSAQSVPAGAIGIAKQGEVAPPIPLKWANDEQYLKWYNACDNTSLGWALVEACSQGKTYTWSLFMRSDKGTIPTLVDQRGLRCGVDRTELGGCSRSRGAFERAKLSTFPGGFEERDELLEFKPGLHITQARDGVFALTLRPVGGAGRVLTTIETFGHWCYGSFSGSCVFDASGVGSRRQIGPVNVPAGAVARVFFRVFWRPDSLGFDLDPRVEIVAAPAATPTPAPVGATPRPSSAPAGPASCVADAQASSFSTGALLDRSRSFFDYAQGNPGRAAALVVSEGEIASALAEAVKTSPVSIRDVSARIQSSKVRLAGQVMQFGVRLEVQLAVRYGKLDLAYRFEDVPRWVQDQVPSAPLTEWRDGMNRDATWQRILWRDGCLALLGTRTGQASATTGSAPPPQATAPPPIPVSTAVVTVAGPTPTPTPVTVAPATTPSGPAATPNAVSIGRPPQPLGAPDRPAPTWTALETWSGSGQFRSTPFFTVTASQWRVKWELTGYCCTVVKVLYNYGNFGRLLQESNEKSGTLTLDGPGYFQVYVEQPTSSFYTIVVEELK